MVQGFHAIMMLVPDLGLRQLDQHFCCRLDQLHLFQYSSSIIGDDHLAVWLADLRQKGLSMPAWSRSTIV